LWPRLRSPRGAYSDAGSTWRGFQPGPKTNSNATADATHAAPTVSASRQRRAESARGEERGGAYGIRTALQIGHFFRRSLHRGLHRTRLSEAIRREITGYAARIETSAADPFLSFLDAAPADDEPVTGEEETAMAEVEADRRAGLPRIPFDEIKRAYSPR
jgi:hypothetical protein